MPNTSDPDHLLTSILPFAVAMEIHRMADVELIKARLSRAIQPALKLDIEGAARA